MTDSIIAKLAADCAATILAQGWDQDGSTYSLLPGDAEALADALGREPERGELLEFESAIADALNPAVDGEWNSWRYPTAEEVDAGRRDWDMVYVGSAPTKDSAVELLPEDRHGQPRGQVQFGRGGEVDSL